MLKHLLRWSAAAGSLVFGIAFAQDLVVGQQAPDFSLLGSDGKTYTLDEMRGQYVVIAWFPKAFTGG